MVCNFSKTNCNHIGNEAVCRQCPIRFPDVGVSKVREATLKDNLHGVAKKPARANKYKQQIDLIFMALEQPMRNGGIIPLEVTKEYKFHAARKWRFDYALEAIKVCVEYEGLPLQDNEKSRHTTIKGFANDCEKYSEAAIMGWCVIRVNALSVESGLAHSLIKRAVDSRRIGLPQVGRQNRLMGCD